MQMSQSWIPKIRMPSSSWPRFSCWEINSKSPGSGWMLF
jgi:hypothetical protein